MNADILKMLTNNLKTMNLIKEVGENNFEDVLKQYLDNLNNNRILDEDMISILKDILNLIKKIDGINKKVYIAQRMSDSKTKKEIEKFINKED